MGRVIEYTLMSVDGVVADPRQAGFMDYRDDAYLDDGLGLLSACGALLMGRTTYQQFATTWPRRDHPWADRLNTMKKYVFTSTLEHAEWTNSTIVHDDAAAAVATLKQQDRSDLLILGHGRLAETLWRQHLTDLLHLSIHPLFVGSGGVLFREGMNTTMTLVAAKTFSRIVKLSYAPQSS